MSEEVTIRDRFAMAALTGLCANPKLVWEHQPTPSTSFDDPPGMGYGEPIIDFAKEAYIYADAMLAARSEMIGGTGTEAAKARRHAAAPDMLEALEVALTHIVGLEEVCRSRVGDSGPSRAERMVRAAITKARGE